MIKLKYYSVTNFKTIKECSLDFSKGAVGLIGENGSGKTNIARAIDFFVGVMKTPKKYSNVNVSHGGMPPQWGWERLGHNPSHFLAAPKEGERMGHRMDIAVESKFMSALSIPLNDLKVQDSHEFRISLECVVNLDGIGNPFFLPKLHVSV